MQPNSPTEPGTPERDALRKKLEALDIEFLHGVPVRLPDEAIKTIMQLIEADRATLEKAYGGCHKCYGKGYATVRSGVRGSADFYGDRSFVIPPTNKMKFCTCDRGKQLRQLLAAEGEGK